MRRVDRWTNALPNRPTDQPTDTASYRGALPQPKSRITSFDFLKRRGEIRFSIFIFHYHKAKDEKLITWLQRYASLGQKRVIVKMDVNRNFRKRKMVNALKRVTPWCPSVMFSVIVLHVDTSDQHNYVSTRNTKWREIAFKNYWNLEDTSWCRVVLWRTGASQRSIHNGVIPFPGMPNTCLKIIVKA